MMPSWGAIFDWDGVVVDSSGHHEASWQRLAQEEGFVLPLDHVRRGFGMKNDRIIAELLGWTRDPREIARLSRKKEVLYRQLIRDSGMAPIPGVEAWLGALQDAAIPCAVASSTERLNITSVLSLLGLHPYFASVVSAEDVTRGKPDPQVFLLAAQSLKLPAERCVVFEDTPAGIQAARAAEMRVIAVGTTHPAEALRDADRVIRRLDELTVGTLEEWFR